MDDGTEYTASLANVAFVKLTTSEGDVEVAYGTILGDTKERFRTGERVRTSIIVEKTDDYIKTLNSVYRIIK
jgi:hypothetical protein